MTTNLRSNEYPRRKRKGRKKYITSLLNRLAELERRSDPSGGTNSAKGKDLAAFDAVETAGELVRTVAGWAIDHQAGLAVEELSFVPLQPSQTKQHPQYRAQRDAVDDHKHERNSVNLVRAVDPRVVRR